jgi:hypothetical protein
MVKNNSPRVITQTRVLDLALVLSLLAVACIAAPIALVNAAAPVKVGSQFVIGATVNCALIFAAIRLNGKYKTAALICAPSICTMALAFLPGVTIYGIIMVPAIWIGNATLVLAFKFLNKKITFVPTAIIAIALKVSILFSIYLAIASFGVFPSPVAAALYTTMGVMQIITATLGATAAYGVIKLTKRI